MRNPAVPLIALLLVGCSTGPSYTNTQAQDAATLLATSDFSGGQRPVWIDTIDGATAPKPPLYLTPGRHHLSLHLDDAQGDQLRMSGDQVDEGQMEMDIFVRANGSYRLIGLMSGSGRFYVVQLIDVASGSVCSQGRSRIDPLRYESPKVLDP